MKHIFVIHSAITYLSALGIIEAEKLALEDCILVSETFSRHSPLGVELLPYLGGLKANRYKLSNYLKPYRAIDRHIARLTGGKPFVAYISTVNRLARYLMTNPRCTQFHFAEEGTSAYVPWIEFHALTAHNTFVPIRPRSVVDRLRDIKLPLLRGYSSQISALPLFYNAYSDPRRKFYGFSPASHHLVSSDRRALINLRAVDARFAFSRTLVLDNSVIWIGDCVELANRTVDQYLASIQKGFVDRVLLPGNIDHIFVKFHYRESQSSRLRTLKLFAHNNISATVIDDSVIMEIEFMNTTTAKVYSTYSSLLLYASLSGNQAWSVDRYYGGGLTDERMDFMWQYVKKI